MCTPSTESVMRDAPVGPCGARAGLAAAAPSAAGFAVAGCAVAAGPGGIARLARCACEGARPQDDAAIKQASAAALVRTLTTIILPRARGPAKARPAVRRGPADAAHRADRCADRCAAPC